MNAFLYVFIILLLFVFQTTILHGFTLFDVRPDVTLILTFFVAVNSRETKGAASGFALGLIQDCMANSLPGTNALSKGIIGFILSSLKDKINVEDTFSQAIFLLLASFINTGIFVLIFALTNSDKAAINIILNKALLASIYTAIAGPFIIRMIIFINKKIGSFGKVPHKNIIKGTLIN